MSGALGQKVHGKPTGGSGWRGLSLAFVAGAVVDSTTFPIGWDYLLAGTDGIRSTGTHTFSGEVVATGAAGVVPSGMGGLWRLCACLDVLPAGSDPGDFHALKIIVNDFDLVNEADLAVAGFGDVTFIASRFKLVIPPFVLSLDVGDVVWCDYSMEIGATIGGTAETYLTSTFLMEFLG